MIATLLFIAVVLPLTAYLLIKLYVLSRDVWTAEAQLIGNLD